MTRAIPSYHIGIKIFWDFAHFLQQFEKLVSPKIHWLIYLFRLAWDYGLSLFSSRRRSTVWIFTCFFSGFYVFTEGSVRAPINVIWRRREKYRDNIGRQRETARSKQTITLSLPVGWQDNNYDNWLSRVMIVVEWLRCDFHVDLVATCRSPRATFKEISQGNLTRRSPTCTERKSPANLTKYQYSRQIVCWHGIANDLLHWAEKLENLFVWNKSFISPK